MTTFDYAPHHLDPAELSLAQAVVFSRTILNPWADRYIEAALAIGVPMYYYLDDNFEVLRPSCDELKDYTLENLGNVWRVFLASWYPIRS